MEVPETACPRKTTAREIAKHPAESAYAAGLLTVPEATGRLLFTGCSLSTSASKVSLKQYMPLAAKQYAMKTKEHGTRYSNSKMWRPKNNGMKQNMFLSHCWGRRRV